jgi:Domain of unknown function (DUF4337)
MAELKIHGAEPEASDPAGKKIGILDAVLAVTLAIVSIVSHRTHTEAILHQAKSNDAWAHYEANRVTYHNLELGENLLFVLNEHNPAAEKMRADYAAQKEKYDQQSKESHETAQRAEQQAASDERRVLRYDIGEALLQISLVLTSLYFISRKKMFPAMGAAAAALGVIVAITGLAV